MNFRRKSAVFITFLLILGLILPGQAANEGARRKPSSPVDTERMVSLTVLFTARNERNGEELVFPDTDIRLYRIAEIDAKGSYTVRDRFSRFCMVDLNDGSDTDVFRRLANQTLRSQIYEYGIEPDVEGITGSDGSVTFDSLKQGLYLVIAVQNGDVDGDLYKPNACLISLPTANADSSAWEYDTVIRMKYSFAPGSPPESTPEPDGSQTEKLSVYKLWDDDDDSEEERPEEIEVHLWCDGELYDTVLLSEENDWAYLWETLPEGHDWMVSESIVIGYYMSLEQVGSAFILTNTFDEELYDIDMEETPLARLYKDEPDNPPPGPEIHRIEEKPPVDEEEYDEFDDDVPHGRLAQTGVLWWPVMVLAATGMLCCVIGFVLLRRFA